MGPLPPSRTARNAAKEAPPKRAPSHKMVGGYPLPTKVYATSNDSGGGGTLLPKAACLSSAFLRKAVRAPVVYT